MVNGYDMMEDLGLGEQNNCAQEPLDNLFCRFPSFPCCTNDCVLVCFPPLTLPLSKIKMWKFCSGNKLVFEGKVI